jgi:Ca-activated chloride channel family protein
MMLILLLAIVFSVDPGDIGKVNARKSEAKKAFIAGDYKTAADHYQYLVDSAGVAEDEVNMNLAHSYFQLNDTTQAIGSYQRLTQSKDAQLRSTAYQQLGVLNNREGKFEEALQFLKQALKADPSNQDARYNYEMIKKKVEEQKKKEQQQQDQKDKEQEKKDEQNKDSKDEQNKDKKDQQKTDEQKEQEKKDQEQKDKEQKEKEQQQKEQQDKEQKEKDNKEIPPSVKDKLKEMNMSEEKAKMILEAMKNQEIQYLQQNKRKGSKPKDKNKPDW